MVGPRKTQITRDMINGVHSRAKGGAENKKEIHNFIGYLKKGMRDIGENASNKAWLYSING